MTTHKDITLSNNHLAGTAIFAIFPREDIRATTRGFYTFLVRHFVWHREEISASYTTPKLTVYRHARETLLPRD